MQKSILLIAFSMALIRCGGYSAADPSDLQARPGEIVGVLVDDRGKAHPDAWLELYRSTESVPISVGQGMDSDGRFGVFPPGEGVYNIVGTLGEPEKSTNKAIAQNVTFSQGGSMNIGKIQAAKIGLLAVHVTAPDGGDASGVTVEVLGYGATTTTAQEGIGAIAKGIPAGTYTVRFSKSGFKTLEIPDVVISSEATRTLESVTMESDDSAAN